MPPLSTFYDRVCVTRTDTGKEEEVSMVCGHSPRTTAVVCNDRSRSRPRLGEVTGADGRPRLPDGGAGRGNLTNYGTGPTGDANGDSLTPLHLAFTEGTVDVT